MTEKARVDYCQHMIQEVRNSLTSNERDFTYLRALAVIGAFYGFNDIGLGHKTRLYEDAEEAHRKWPDERSRKSL